MLKIYQLTMDFEENPQLVRQKGVRFAWKIKSDKNNIEQKSYRITIECDSGFKFDSGLIYSNDSYNITFDELILPTAVEGVLTVEVADNNGEVAKESMCFSTEIGKEGWKNAKWIRPKEFISGWAPYLRKKFKVLNVKKAVMYACGLGCAEYYINGKKTDDFYIDPPMTNYDKEIFYRRLDVTNLICEGENAICAILGEGFYSQERVWQTYGSVAYGKECLILKIDIIHNDNSKTEIVTDDNGWLYKYGPITLNNIYGGEIYDARLEIDGFADFDSSDNGWQNVIIDEQNKGELIPCNIPPIRAIRELPAVSYQSAHGVKDGVWIYDVGENIAGVAEFYLPHSPVGATYVFRFAETVDELGQPDYRSTGCYANQVLQQDIYIAKGAPNGETYKPRFCYHGFRYIEISGIHDISLGYGTQPKVEMVKAIQLSTDFKRASTFTTTHKYLDKTQKLMENTYRSNYFGYPMDCPTRERCGWLGDNQIVSSWGLLNYKTASCYEKYLMDIKSSTEILGVCTNVAPGKRTVHEAHPLYGAAQVNIPYNMYYYYGDSEAVTKYFNLMENWVEHELKRSDDYVISAGIGDWDTPVGNNDERRMPIKHSSTFVFFEICSKMSALCKELKIGDSDYYDDLADKIKSSLIRNFYDKENHTFGYVGSDGVALYFGIYPDGEENLLLNSLLTRLKSTSYQMVTGLFATKYLVATLCDRGLIEDAFNIMFNLKHPSVATIINQGATTLWEELNQGAQNDRSIYVLTYNHAFHGAFLYTNYIYVAGVKPKNAGFKTFEFAPCKFIQGEEFDAVMDTIAGEIKVSLKNNIYNLTIPANTTCIVKNAIIDGKKSLGETVLKSGDYKIEF